MVLSCRLLSCPVDVQKSPRPWGTCTAKTLSGFWSQRRWFSLKGLSMGKTTKMDGLWGKKKHQNGWCGGSPISGNFHFNRSTRSASFWNWKSRSESRSKAWSICIYLWTSKDLVHFLRPGRQYQAGTESHRNGHQSHPYHREGIWTTQGAKAAWKVMTGQGFQTFIVFQYVFNDFLGGWVKTKLKAIYIYILLYIFIVCQCVVENGFKPETRWDWVWLGSMAAASGVPPIF